MKWDAFLFADELDLLECRLVELESIPDLKHVLVEATTTFQGRPKPLHYAENRSRFERWSDRIVHVVAELPDTDDPWQREAAQRECVRVGLAAAEQADIVMFGDVDEIPSEVVARNLRPAGFVAFEMAFHPFCVDWAHPARWHGTVAARFGIIGSFQEMRERRNTAAVLRGAGWHFTWVGCDPAVKLHSFSHTEIIERAEAFGLDRFGSEGVHVDGQRLIPVSGHPLPKWVAAGNAPRSWWRP